MYRALRDNDKLVAANPASWYLDQAAHTVLGMWNVSRWYSQMGLMVGTVFLELLRDLHDESHPQARAVRDIMYNRTAVGVTYFSSAACKPGPCTCYNCTHAKGNATTDCPSDAAHKRTVTVCTSRRIRTQRQPRSIRALRGLPPVGANTRTRAHSTTHALQPPSLKCSNGRLLTAPRHPRARQTSA